MLGFKGGQTVGRGWRMSPVGPAHCRFPKRLALLILMATVIFIAHTGAALAGSEEASMCLGCHGMPGMVKEFKNGESVSLQVEENDFKGTVHGFLGCTDCHADVSMETHPAGTEYGSKRSFAFGVTGACRTCHQVEQLMEKPAHKVLAGVNTTPCSDCHGAHAILKISELREAKGTRYCMGCHGRKMSVSMGGETVSLAVDEKEIAESVHPEHACTDCHMEFLGGAHPAGGFKSERAMAAAMTASCKNCHPDEGIRVGESVHHEALKRGNPDAPLCSDCHGFHSVRPGKELKTVAGSPCNKCHTDAFEAYSKSVHGQAKGRTATCSSCHSAHEVQAALASMPSSGRCGECHDVVGAHGGWLPNTALHMEYVACTACHVPEAERAVYINVTERGTGKIIKDGPDIQAAFEGAKDAEIDGRGLWNIYRKLYAEKAGFTGVLGIKDGGKSHSLAEKGEAVGRCEDCHMGGAFSSVSIVLASDEGKTETYPVKPSVLGSVFSFLPLGQFYVMGNTRLTLIDIAGILMILGGASFPALHITARVLTRGRRKGKV